MGVTLPKSVLTPEIDNVRRNMVKRGVDAKPNGLQPHPAAVRSCGKALAERKWPAMPTHENARQFWVRAKNPPRSAGGTKDKIPASSPDLP